MSERNKENGRPTALLKRFAREEGGGVQRAPNQEPGSRGATGRTIKNGQNERNRRVYRRRRKNGRKGGGWGRRETSLVPRKLLAGEYTAATGSFRGTSRGLYVLMYSLIGLPLSSVPHATPPFNPSRSPLRGLYSERYMLMESYIWFIMRSRTADEYHLYWRQESEREMKMETPYGVHLVITGV